jgi:hypothetical protein
MVYQVAAEAEHCRPSGGGGWYPEEQELSSILNITHHVGYSEIKERIFVIFQVLFGTLLHLPTLRFHCVRGHWNGTQRLWHFQSDALTTRLDLIHNLG